MNSVELANNLINRAKNLQEFTVTTKLTGKLRFKGEVPFDMTIKGNVLPDAPSAPATETKS